MLLKDCFIGMIVKESVATQGKKKIGYIAGLSINCVDEIILDIQWANGTKYPTHPANVKKLED